MGAFIKTCDCFTRIQSDAAAGGSMQMSPDDAALSSPHEASYRPFATHPKGLLLHVKVGHISLTYYPPQAKPHPEQSCYSTRLFQSIHPT